MTFFRIRIYPNKTANMAGTLVRTSMTCHNEAKDLKSTCSKNDEFHELHPHDSDDIIIIIVNGQFSFSFSPGSE